MTRSAAHTSFGADDISTFDLSVLVREDVNAVASLTGARPGSVSHPGPGITSWLVDQPAVTGRIVLARFGHDIGALLTDYSRTGSSTLCARGDGLLMLQLRLDGDAVVDTAGPHARARAAVTFFPDRSTLDWRIPSAGRWRSLALLGTPDAFEKRWGLGAPLTAAIGLQRTDRRSAAEPLRRAWRVTRESLDVLRALLDCRLGGALASAYFDARIAQLICEFVAAGPATSVKLAPSAHVRAALRRARSLLIADPARPRTLGSLAREVGLGRTVLAERFRAEFGETVHECLTRARLRMAWEALRHSDQKIATIAAAVGYSNAASFARAFKAQFGVTPCQVNGLTATPD